jgi:hypothetical protein
MQTDSSALTSLGNPVTQDMIDRRNKEFQLQLVRAVAVLDGIRGKDDLNATGFRVMLDVIIAASRRYCDFHPTGRAYIARKLREVGAPSGKDEDTVLLTLLLAQLDSYIEAGE